MTILAALLWLPFSFFLHSALHELGHAVVAMRAGYDVRISVVPGMRDGRWTWAYCYVNGEAKRPMSMPLYLGAPVLIELLWFAMAVTVGALLPRGWWAALIAVEVVCSIVDVANWLVGTVRRASQSDSARFSRHLGIPRWAFAAALVVPVALGVLGLWVVV